MTMGSRSDYEECREEREEERMQEPPRKKAKKANKQKRKERMVVEPTEDVGSNSREFMLLYKLMTKTTRTLTDKIEELEKEMSRTATAHKALEVEVQKGTGGEASSGTLSPLGNKKEEKKIVYSITNLNSEKPKFSGIGNKDKYGKIVHPVTFLEDLTAYLRKIPAQGRELDIVQECLMDQARDWSRIYMSRWHSFDDFKSDFLDTYWSEVEQNRVRRDIVSNKWDKGKYPTMLSHFLGLAGQVNLLTFTIPERQLVADIMRHYPKEVQQLWALSREDSILAASEFLRNMDMINQSEGESAKIVSQSMNSHPGGRQDPKQYKRRFENWVRPRGGAPRDRGGVQATKPFVATSSAAVVEVETPKEKPSLN